ncbi:unnamed protein product [Clonostachys byssicola]|uniref:Amidase domain-containing protein n=1 Tax=Clonostachys byssicola TaxID=160290 RepID=A0A9N9U511_9HYPO|nr:unnamed protein product [Clonostachys byssicola]
MAIFPEYQQLVDQKRAKQASLIPPEWRLPKAITDKVSPSSNASAFDLMLEHQILTKEELDITENYTAAALVKSMAAGNLTSLEVTTAFCKRSAVAQQLTNCLTEIFFEKAFERARQLDEYLAKEGVPKGPLHGLPISIKDTYMVEGEYATISYVSKLKLPTATSNSAIVDILLEAGAVLYVKTTVPQTLFVCESFNSIFGTTLNPHRLSLSAGGSTSGEGVLVAFRGSVLGVGSDIGGSARVPALANGTYGFKPSSNRLPYGGQQEILRKGWPGIMPAAGPLASSAEDLTLFTRTVIEARPWLHDATAYHIPWRSVPKKDRLVVGFFPGDELFPVFPPIARALSTAVDKLKAAGHTVKRLTCPPLIAILTTAARSFALDQSGRFGGWLAEAGEEPIKAVSDLIAQMHSGADDISLESVWQFTAEREDILEESAKIWRENELDVLLTPGARGTAVPHGNFGMPIYSIPWNLLDVVGWRFEDEEVLNATEVISEVLNN